MASERGGARRLLDWLRANGIPLAHLALCAAIVAPISMRPGWPRAHDAYPLFERVEAFRRELLAGNVFPLWAPFASNGHGMPMPLFYHRLFNTAAGLLALAVGTVAAVKVAFVPALALGAAGMVAATEELDCPPWVRLWAGAFLPLAHYTFSNWLVRGSAAELTAGMLLPWVIAACLRMQAGKPFGARLGGTMAALFYAHLAICLYAVLLVAVAALCCAVDRRRTPSPAARYLARGLGVAVGIAALVAGPTALAILLIGPEFRLGKLKIYVPQEQIPPWQRYFIDGFPWGQTWQGLSIEIGRYVLGALLVLIVLTLARRARLRAAPFAFLTASCLAYFGLQLPQAAHFYRAVALSQVLQFPWRLLVFITPLVILMVAALARAVAATGRPWAWASMVVLGGAWVAQAVFAASPLRADYGWMTPREQAADLASGDVQTGAGEFLPTDLTAPYAPPPTDLIRLEGAACRLVSSNVDLRALQTRPFQRLELTLDAPAGCTVHVSQFWTTLVRVHASDGGRLVRTADDTVDVVLPAGPATVTVERRGLLRAIVHALRAR